MSLYIDYVPGKGRGVFAKKSFKKGEIIEVCPVIVLSDNEIEHIRNTQLEHYHFLWGDDKIAICLGCGSLYNHSFNPNSEFDADLLSDTIIFRAVRDIAEGEEITHDYDWPIEQGTPDWYLQKESCQASSEATNKGSAHK